MAKRKSEPSGERNARTMLQETLARLRERAGLSLAALCEETSYDRAYLHKLETGARLGSSDVMAALDRVYGTGDQLGQLWELARQDAFGDRYTAFMRLEREATTQYMYVESVIPGLLQTEGYAAEIMSQGWLPDGTALNARVAARLSRQCVLDGDDACHFRALIDEAAFRRTTTDQQVWADQLSALLEVNERRHVTLQVVPHSAGLHDLLGGSLTILWLADGRSVAYLEGNRSGELVEEPRAVARLRLSYDLLRDRALSPERSTEFIMNLMKEIRSCETVAPT